MNTKLATACLAGVLIGAASLLAQAQDTNVLIECVGNGVTPPFWDTGGAGSPANHHPELRWCCTGYQSGSQLLGESPRYWPNMVVRTFYDGNPDMGCGVLP